MNTVPIASKARNPTTAGTPIKRLRAISLPPAPTRGGANQAGGNGEIVGLCGRGAGSDGGGLGGVITFVVAVNAPTPSDKLEAIESVTLVSASVADTPLPSA